MKSLADFLCLAAAFIAAPFIMRSHQGFVMRSSDNYSHFISQYRIQGIIVIESTAPHGRPEKISLQAQDQFKHMTIELMIKAPEILKCPSGKRRSLIIQEYTPVFNQGMVGVGS